MPNLLAVGWIEEADNTGNQAAAVVGRDDWESPTSNIEVEWLPVDTYVVLDEQAA
ncbi:MAG: hypothetical protein PVI15_09375 [Chromatiales bacterium]|jgi:hypothetical protein